MYQLGKHKGGKFTEKNLDDKNTGGIKLKLNRVLLIMTIALLIASFALPHAYAATESDLTRVIRSKKLRVGMELGVALRSFMDPATKKPAGMEVDLITEFCSRIGVEVEIIDIAWDGLIPALVSDRIDVICSGMGRFEKRALTVDFSDAMWFMGQGLAVSKNDARFKTWEDCNKAGVRVGGTLGGLSQQVAKDKLPKAEFKAFPSYNQTGLALMAGQIDVWLDDDFLLVNSAKEHPEIKVLNVPSALCISTGMAVRKGSDLLPVINLFVYNAKTDGLFIKVADKWGLPHGMNAPLDPTK